MSSPYEHLNEHLRAFLEEPDYSPEACDAFEAGFDAPGRTDAASPDEVAYLHWKMEQKRLDPNWKRPTNRTPEKAGVLKEQPKPKSAPHTCPCCGEKLVCVTPGCEASDIPVKARRLTMEELATLRELREQRLSINKLAKHFKVDRKTIQRRLEQMGLRYKEGDND